MQRLLPLLLIGVGCASAPPAALAPASGPASAPASQAAATASADMVATRLVEAVGDPYKVQQIRFDFVVYDEGEEKMRRSHVWRPMDGTDTVTAKGETRVVGDLATHTPNPGSEAEADKAYAAWVNDVFWLLAPAKAMDAGVTRVLEEDGRLSVTFSGVGLTPGDRYTYSFDPVTHRVTKWDFVLQGGHRGSFLWEGYQTFGPLTFSTRRPAADGKRELRLENIIVTP